MAADQDECQDNQNENDTVVPHTRPGAFGGHFGRIGLGFIH
jgi:hypothetical protein